MMMNLDYSLLFQDAFGSTDKTSRINLLNLSREPVQSQLRRAGINTSSSQYKAAVNAMSNAAHGGMAFTNVQSIKNQMSYYDDHGNYIDPVSKLPGLPAANSAVRKTDVSRTTGQTMQNGVLGGAVRGVSEADTKISENKHEKQSLDVRI